MMNFRFMQSHGGRLYMHRVTSQVLLLLFILWKGFMPSVLKVNLMFLASVQSLGKFYLFFPTGIHQPGVSTLCLAFILLCAITST
jgi:hypothetical protein